MNNNYLHSDITEKIIKFFYKVYNDLGYGFLEKGYENALFIELTGMGLFVEKQKSIKVYYQENEVGKYFVNLIISKSVIEVGLLLNFGKRPQLRRKIFSNKKTEKLTIN